MPLRKLSSTDAFVCIDLDDAPSGGIVRRAPKILQSGAWDLARSATYSFAAFRLPIAGASAGINADDAAADDAVAAARDEFAALEPTVALDGAKGVDVDGPFHPGDPRGPLAGSPELTAHSAITAAAWALDGLSGRTVAIEGIDTSPVALAVAEAAVAAGATVTAVSGGPGLALRPEGFSPADLAGDGWAGDDPKAAHFLWGSDVDVILAGSKAGILNHVGAGFLKARAVVPWGPLPFTTRALAVARTRDVVLVPDFLSAAGGLVGGHLDSTRDGARAAIETNLVDQLTAGAGHDHSLFLGCCARAEDFLSSWRESLPFGRPLAA